MCGGRLRGTGRDCCLRQPDTVDVFWGSYWTASRRCCSSRVARSLKCDSPPLLRVGQEYITFFTAAVARVLVGKWLGSVGDALWKGHAQPVKTTVFVSFDQQAFVASATTTPLFLCASQPPPPFPGQSKQTAAQTAPGCAERRGFFSWPLLRCCVLLARTCPLTARATRPAAFGWAAKHSAASGTRARCMKCQSSRAA